MGVHGGFKREAAKQRLAKSMNSANTHTSGQVEHICKQSAGLAAGFWRARHRQRVQFSIERRILQRDPPAKALLQPNGHFCGGGFCKSKAQNTGGVAARCNISTFKLAGQHKPQQAVYEQLCFAAPRRSRHKNRCCRV